MQLGRKNIFCTTSIEYVKNIFVISFILLSCLILKFGPTIPDSSITQSDLLHGEKMTPSQSDQPLDEHSPSVQAHLTILQSVIQRMATNSSSCKAWCITIVSAILVIIADKGKPNYAFIALLPTLLFLALDAYYLALEKAFRAAYEEFVRKVHSGSLSAPDLFAVKWSGKMSSHQLDALKSFSVWGFYVALLIMIELARSVVLKQAG